jgi:hypothetical protein
LSTGTGSKYGTVGTGNDTGIFLLGNRKKTPKGREKEMDKVPVPLLVKNLKGKETYCYLLLLPIVL